MFASGCSAGNDELTENDSRFTLNACSDVSKIPFVGSTRAGMRDNSCLPSSKARKDSVRERYLDALAFVQRHDRFWKAQHAFLAETQNTERRD